ncbi:MAG: hypothetical protein GX957_14985 [Clostridiaceae bacterium]|nr:hypothetical protein [Clostridiaceae bacterium]
MPSVVKTNWSNGVFEVIVEHNGPVDIEINCAGAADKHLVHHPTPTVVTPPERPAFYTGPRQYEAEHFEYKNIAELVTNGVHTDVYNYTGQGYMRFGRDADARARTYVDVNHDDLYTLRIKYSVAGADIDTVDLYINSEKVATPKFIQTTSPSDWAILEQEVALAKGTNIIEFKANSPSESPLYLDHIVVDGDFRPAVATQ